MQPRTSCLWRQPAREGGCGGGVVAGDGSQSSQPNLDRSQFSAFDGLRVHLKPGLPWIAGNADEPESSLVDDLIEKVSWRLHLEDRGERVPPVASQGVVCSRS